MGTTPLKINVVGQEKKNNNKGRAAGKEEIFSYQRDLPLDLVLNLDQTPLSYVTRQIHVLLKACACYFLKIRYTSDLIT